MRRMREAEEQRRREEEERRRQEEAARRQREEREAEEEKRRRALAAGAVDVASIVRQYQDGKYTDAAFPSAETRSEVAAGGRGWTVEWKRAAEIAGKPLNFQVQEFDATDVHQGGLGDCWYTRHTRPTTGEHDRSR